MYVPDPPTRITLPLVASDDAELTCFACVAKRTCEYAIVVKFPGLKRSYGIHAECVEKISL